MELTGAREVAATLKELPEKIQKKILRQTMKRVIDPIYTQIKANLPVKTGNLRDSVIKKIQLQTRKGAIVGEVIASSGKGRKGHHAYWIEEGFNLTAHKETARRGPYGTNRILKRVEGKHIFRDTFKANAEQSISLFYEAISDEVKTAQKELGSST